MGAQTWSKTARNCLEFSRYGPRSSFLLFEHPGIVLLSPPIHARSNSRYPSSSLPDLVTSYLTLTYLSLFSLFSFVCLVFLCFYCFYRFSWFSDSFLFFLDFLLCFYIKAKKNWLLVKRQRVRLFFSAAFDLFIQNMPHLTFSFLFTICINFFS